MIFAPKAKRDDEHKICQHKMRACWDGRFEQDLAKKEGRELDGFSPTMRHTTFKCHNATNTLRPGYVCEQLDVESAYHKGEFPPDAPPCYARPPRHAVNGTRFQKYDKRGVAYVWRMKVPHYGQTMARPYWFNTAIKFLTEERKWKQSEYDPCYLWIELPDGSRLDMGLYVDDGWCTHNKSKHAIAELDAIDAKFTIKRQPGSYFLGCNVDARPGHCHLSMRTYSEALAEKYLPKPLAEYPAYTCPSTDELREAYKAAVERVDTLDAAGITRYMSKCGGAIYACPAARVGECYTIGICARTLTFPTARMEACLDRAIVCMAQHPHDGPR